MKTTKKILLGTAALTLLVGATAVHAHNRSDESPWKHSSQTMAEKATDRLEKIIDLSDQQQTDLQEIFQQSLDKWTADRETRHAELTTLLKRDEVSAVELAALINRHQNREEKIRQSAELITDIHAVLTPAQRAQLLDNPRMMTWLHGATGLRHSRLGIGKSHHDRDHHDGHHDRHGHD